MFLIFIILGSKDFNVNLFIFKIFILVGIILVFLLLFGKKGVNFILE